MFPKAKRNNQGGKSQTGIKVDKLDYSANKPPFKMVIFDNMLTGAGEKKSEKTNHYKRSGHIGGKNYLRGRNPLLAHSGLLPRARYTRPE
jgi:hypothetical protein